jgi:phospholipase A1
MTFPTARILLSLPFALAISRGLAASTSLLAPPPSPVTAGAPAQVELVTHNRGEDEIRFLAQPAMRGVLMVGADTWQVELTAVEEVSTAAIGPGRFAVRAYSFVVPAQVAGRAILELPSEPDIAPAVIAVGPTVARGRAVGSPLTSLLSRKPTQSALLRGFTGRMGTHEPVYFAYGPGEPGAKFQFSFKYRLLNFGAGDEDTVPATLQFAFTQRSLWDIDATSSPFFDTSYMPELIFESLAPASGGSKGLITWPGFQIAFKHESNGRDGPVSRSLNTLYARTAIELGTVGPWQLLIVPEAFVYVGGLSENPDLKDYRGYGQLRVYAGRKGGTALMATGMAGKDFRHGSLQLDLTVPFRMKWIAFETLLLVQYFNGYGESLRDYGTKSESVRAGVSLVR